MIESVEFTPFPKIARLNRAVIVTEKIDGTNAAVGVTEDGTVYAQSRKRIITPDCDNFGFARWVRAHEDELRELGPGVHFGEWWGRGIQRTYGLDEKRFSLFNVGRWENERPACCYVVPTILTWSGDITWAVNESLRKLALYGSAAAPGFTKPEGIVVFHTASGGLYKVTFEQDDIPKGLAVAA